MAISPWSLIALARTSKQTTTCHVMSHVSESVRIYQNLSESVRIYHQPHHQQQYDQTKITQYKTDNANNYQISNNCTTAPMRFHSFPPYLPPVPLVSITKLQRQKVPTSAIWIPTPVFASLSASIARNLRLPCLLQLLLPCPP